MGFTKGHTLLNPPKLPAFNLHRHAIYMIDLKKRALDASHDSSVPTLGRIGSQGNKESNPGDGPYNPPLLSLQVISV